MQRGFSGNGLTKGGKGKCGPCALDQLKTVIKILSWAQVDGGGEKRGAIWGTSYHPGRGKVRHGHAKNPDCCERGNQRERGRGSRKGKLGQGRTVSFRKCPAPRTERSGGKATNGARRKTLGKGKAKTSGPHLLPPGRGNVKVTFSGPASQVRG